MHFPCSGLHAESVGGEFYAERVPIAAPDEVFASLVLDEEGVDATPYARVMVAHDAAVVGERPFGAVGGSHAHAGVLESHPLRLGVVEHILVADFVDVGSPDASLRVPRGARGVAERRADEGPVHEVVGAVDGRVRRVFGGIEVEVSVVGAYDCRVGRTAADDGGGECVAGRSGGGGGGKECRAE